MGILDQSSVLYSTGPSPLPGLKVLYESVDIVVKVVWIKPVGLLRETQSEGHSRSKFLGPFTLKGLVSLFVLHRLLIIISNVT